MLESTIGEILLHLACSGQGGGGFQSLNDLQDRCNKPWCTNLELLTVKGKEQSKQVEHYYVTDQFYICFTRKGSGKRGEGNIYAKDVGSCFLRKLYTSLSGRCLQFVSNC